MENNNLRPASLGAIVGKDSLNDSIKARANMLRGLTSSDAQMNNTDNYRAVPIERLVEFKNHPFQVRDDEELVELAESIKESGLMEAILIRPAENGYYEILAGHRRVAASKKIGMFEITAKILNVDDNEAAIIMTNTNLKRRERILPSERAKAYKMQLEAYKCQGKRNDLILAVQSETDFGANGTEVLDNINFGANGTKVESRDIVAQLNNTSALQVSRYIRLNQLITPLINLVDNEEIPFRAGVAISFLSQEEQQMLVVAMQNGIINNIDLKIAETFKELSKQGQLNDVTISKIFEKEIKAKPQDTYSIFQSATKKALKHFKKAEYNDIEINQEELEQIIVQAIQNYAKREQ